MNKNSTAAYFKNDFIADILRLIVDGLQFRIVSIYVPNAAVFIDNYIKLQNLNCDNRLLSNNRKGNLTRSGGYVL